MSCGAAQVSGEVMFTELAVTLSQGTGTGTGSRQMVDEQRQLIRAVGFLIRSENLRI
jgi:hypothetical protein